MLWLMRKCNKMKCNATDKREKHFQHSYYYVGRSSPSSVRSHSTRCETRVKEKTTPAAHTAHSPFNRCVRNDGCTATDVPVVGRCDGFDLNTTDIAPFATTTSMTITPTRYMYVDSARDKRVWLSYLFCILVSVMAGGGNLHSKC